jgi:Fe/S biogenesis protein NfuA
MSFADPTTQGVLAVTDVARALILESRDAEEGADKLALFLEVSGANDGAYTYDMWFEAAGDAAPRDLAVDVGGLTIVVASSSIDKIRGATLDLAGDGLVMLNPNTPPPSPAERQAAAADLNVPVSDLSSAVERAVLAILEAEINPQIAAHGGRADLVAVEEGVAYLRLSGGCQGCGMAQVTLSQGIAVAIREAIPEITDIVDVTEHESGANPYFESAKK